MYVCNTNGLPSYSTRGGKPPHPHLQPADYPRLPVSVRAYPRLPLWDAIRADPRQSGAESANRVFRAGGLNPGVPDKAGA